jgi:hypothetical protein
MTEADFREAEFNLRLTGDEALVLFEWLANFNAREPAFEDQAERRVLWDLEAGLERHLVAPFREDYDAQVAAARGRVRDPDE